MNNLLFDSTENETKNISEIMLHYNSPQNLIRSILLMVEKKNQSYNIQRHSAQISQNTIKYLLENANVNYYKQKKLEQQLRNIRHQHFNLKENYSALEKQLEIQIQLKNQLKIQLKDYKAQAESLYQRIQFQEKQNKNKIKSQQDQNIKKQNELKKQIQILTQNKNKQIQYLKNKFQSEKNQILRNLKIGYQQIQRVSQQLQITKIQLKKTKDDFSTHQKKTQKFFNRINHNHSQIFQDQKIRSTVNTANFNIKLQFQSSIIDQQSIQKKNRQICLLFTQFIKKYQSDQEQLIQIITQLVNSLLEIDKFKTVKIQDFQRKYKTLDKIKKDNKLSNKLQMLSPLQQSFIKLKNILLSNLIRQNEQNKRRQQQKINLMLEKNNIINNFLNQIINQRIIIQKQSSNFFKSKVSSFTSQANKLFVQKLQKLDNIKDQNKKIKNLITKNKQKNKSFKDNMQVKLKNQQVLNEKNQEKINELQNKLNNQIQQNQTLTNYNNNLKQQINKFNKKVKELEQNIIKLNKQKEQNNKKINNLQKNVSELQNKPTFLTESSLFDPFKDSKDINYIMSCINKATGRKVKRSKTLFKMCALDPHAFIDNYPNILLVVHLKNGHKICGFSELPFNAKLNSTKGNSCLININNQKCYQLKNIDNVQSIIYDKYFIIFGNSQIRIRNNDNLMFSNFGMHSNYFDNKGEKAESFLGSNVKQIQMLYYEILQIKFQNTQFLSRPWIVEAQQ